MGLWALHCSGIQIRMEAILACHSALSTERLAGWQIGVKASIRMSERSEFEAVSSNWLLQSKQIVHGFFFFKRKFKLRLDINNITVQ